MPTWFVVLLWIVAPSVTILVAGLFMLLYFLVREDNRAAAQIERSIKDAGAAAAEERRQAVLAGERVWRQQTFSHAIVNGQRYSRVSAVDTPKARELWDEMETQLIHPSERKSS